MTPIASLPIISHEHKFIYTLIPKVACTSIRESLARLLNLTWRPPNNAGRRQTRFEHISRKEIVNYPKYFKFAFVRNPWSRLVSCYHEKMVESPSNMVSKHIIKMNGGNKNVGFPRFVELICGESDSKADIHYRSQNTFFNIKQLDFLGRFETLDADVDRLREHVPISGVLKHFRKTKSSPYQAYYDDRLKQMVGNRYRKDVKLLSYSF